MARRIVLVRQFARGRGGKTNRATVAKRVASEARPITSHVRRSCNARLSQEAESQGAVRPLIRIFRRIGHADLTIKDKST